VSLAWRCLAASARRHHSADAKLVEGDYLNVDQSALTASHAGVKKAGDDAYSGSVIRQAK